MRAVATDMLMLHSLSVRVCEDHDGEPWKKQLKWSRYHLGGRLILAQGAMY